MFLNTCIYLHTSFQLALYEHHYLLWNWIKIDFEKFLLGMVSVLHMYPAGVGAERELSSECTFAKKEMCLLLTKKEH